MKIKRIAFFFLFGVGLLPVAAVNAQTNISFISRNEMYAALPNLVNSINAADSMQAAHKSEIKTNTEALQAQLNLLIGPYGPVNTDNLESLRKRMKPEDTIRLSLLLNEEQLINNKAAMYNTLVNSFADKYIKPWRTKINQAITEYAVQNKTDVIFFIEDVQGALAYLAPRRMITSQVIQLVKGK